MGGYESDYNVPSISLSPQSLSLPRVLVNGGENITDSDKSCVTQTETFATAAAAALSESSRTM